MNIAEIETELLDLVDKPFEPTAFVYRFLEIYNAPKATITKLKQGSGNHAKDTGDVLWKNKLFFRAAGKGQAASTVDAMLADPLTKKHKPRFVFATDGEEVYCRDIKADVAIDPDFNKLNDQFLFFLPLANIERYEAPAENPADVKATGRIAKLYDAILDANGDWIERDYTHDLNQFMTRLLFCFFAEDTSIFAKDVFTSTVMSLTNEDGSDTSAVLDLVFEAMNTKPEDRGHLPDYAKRFPYVNGGLFRDKTHVPKFSKRARRLLKECGELYWKEINPDIFGSMIQAVAQPGLREDMGMHYTSIPNIMKVLQPLFLLPLEADFMAARDSEPKLKKLLQRIYNIRVFDPACGSGNFLIVAYKELRRLEMRIFERQKEIAKQWSLPMTGVRLTQFFGIELTDFATETAKLSLWIAEYQMNELFKNTFGSAPPVLPLRDSGNILYGNAAQIPWEDACPCETNSEIYLVGNPPYVGSSNQDSDQKSDLARNFARITSSYKNLDYVAIWYLKAAGYCKLSGAKSAFVSTNSICQGEQVAMLWPLIKAMGVEIDFAHQAFKWKNGAKNNAGVTCVIVGLRCISNDTKKIYSNDTSRVVKNISPYLLDMDDTIIRKSNKPLNGLPKMDWGNKPTDGGNLILSPTEKDELVKSYPGAEKFCRRYYGTQEFIKGIERWCLWIGDDDRTIAEEIPPIKTRIDAVKKFRADSDAEQTREYAIYPHRFRQIQNSGEDAILVPIHFSEGRGYFTIGFSDGETSVISNACYAIYGAEPYLLAILSSRIHAVWVTTVCGQLETRIRYSNTMGYHTFPIPRLSNEQRTLLESHTWEIIAAREAYPGKTISWLYGEDTMPDRLLNAHRELDQSIEDIYIGRRFRNDSERLEHLFRLYVAAVKKQAQPTKQKVA